MTASTYKIGQRIQVLISCSGEIFDGIIVNIGEHKGRKVYDLDNSRFVYESQILGAY